MKESTKEVINNINSSRAKIYYQLNQLQTITGMSIRSLKYRMKEVKKKYLDIPTLLNRDSNKWQIHYTIINEFMPIYKKKHTNIMNHRWETLLTWNMLDSYDVKYHQQLISEVKDELPAVNIGYVIELDGRGVNHIHALTDGCKDEVEVAVASVLEKYIGTTQYRWQVEKINNHSSVTNYLLKSGEITII